MVVPLKLTQFYGHSVPRPRIYADVKFSDQRVDPPTSVNDALLCWASDAPWSMGGLSFKGTRSQGKVEGNVHKLRAFLEEDEQAPEASEKTKAPTREAASKPAGNAASLVPSDAKASGKLIEKKRQRSDEESVEATPARKLSRRDAAEGSADEGSPMFVPATEEKMKEGTESAPSLRKKGLKLPAKPEAVEDVTLSSVGATRERRREKLFSSAGKTPRGSKSPAGDGNLAPESSPSTDGGRSTRSGIKKADASVQLSQSSKRGLKTPADDGLLSLESSPSTDGGRSTRSGMKKADLSVQLSQSSKEKPRARKILTKGSLASDEGSSESEDGLQAYLKEKRSTPRRSSRL